MDKVSIIIISYNHENYIEKTIHSALKQNYQNYEIIICDNGSTDNSKKLINNFLNNNNIKAIFHKKNESVSKRLNQCIKFAEGKYICIIFSDDHINENKIKYQVDLFNKIDDDYGVVYGPSLVQNIITNKSYIKNTPIFDGYCLEEYLKNYNKYGSIGFVSAMFKKKCLVDYPFIENVFIENETMLFSIAEKYKFKYDKKILSYLSDGSGNLGKAIFLNYQATQKRINFLENQIKFNNLKKKLIKFFMSQFCLQIAWINLRSNGKKKDTLNFIIKSLSENIFIIFQNFRFFLSVLLLLLPKQIIFKLNYFANFLLGKKENINIKYDQK